jgi:SAM-dependent methyltransferase
VLGHSYEVEIAGRVKDFDEVYRKRGAYHTNAKGFDAWFLDENYTKIAAFFRPGDIILDLGCGEGRLSDYAIQAEAIDGVDYLKSALELNRTVYGKRYRNLFRAHLKDLATLGIPAQSYDRIVSSLTLMYLTRTELLECLNAARRLLRDDGTLIATYPNLTELRSPSAESFELPAPEVQKAFEEADFIVREIAPVCPFLPQEVVRQSYVNETTEAARQCYLLAKSLMEMTNSYHFLIAAGKNGKSRHSGRHSVLPCSSCNKSGRTSRRPRTFSARL